MKPPLLAILIAPDEEMRRRIVAKIKKITLREGHRGYTVGSQVMLCCHLVPWAVIAKITEVKHCILREVTQEEWEADGFIDQEDMLDGLRKFYPKIDWESPVTVIRWDDVSGALVDEYNLNPY